MSKHAIAERKKNAAAQLRADLTAARAGSLDLDGLRTIAQKYPAQFMARFEDLVASGQLSLRKLGSLKALFRALIDVKVDTRVDILGESRTMTTNAFPLAMGTLMVAALNDAYAAVPSVMDELVTDMDSNKKFTHIGKLNHQVHDKIDTKEGEDYPLISAGESFATIGHKRRGFRWKLTQEMLEEDDVGMIALFLMEAGEFGAEVNEEHGLDRVCDRFGSAATPIAPYVYQPNGSGAALFDVDASAQLPSGSRVINNPLVDGSDLDNMRAVLVAQKNTRGRRVSLPLSSEGVLLVPDALSGVADTITGSEHTPGTLNEVNPYGPRGRRRIGKVISTPKLDDISTSAVYLGFPKRIFIRKWKLRVETLSIYADPLEYLRSRAAYEGRVGWDMEIGARDNVGWVQSLAGTVAATAPT